MLSFSHVHFEFNGHASRFLDMESASVYVSRQHSTFLPVPTGFFLFFIVAKLENWFWQLHSNTIKKIIWPRI